MLLEVFAIERCPVAATQVRVVQPPFSEFNLCKETQTGIRSVQQQQPSCLTHPSLSGGTRLWNTFACEVDTPLSLARETPVWINFLALERPIGMDEFSVVTSKDHSLPSYGLAASESTTDLAVSVRATRVAAAPALEAAAALRSCVAFRSYSARKSAISTSAWAWISCAHTEQGSWNESPSRRMAAAPTG